MFTHKSEKGFTLIEVIAVLILIAILSAVAVSRMNSSDDVNKKAMAEVLKGHIRLAQMKAMNNEVTDAGLTTTPGCKSSFGISTVSGTNSVYFMFKDCNTAAKVMLPGADNLDVTLKNMTLTTKIIRFDGWGRPCDEADALGATPVTAGDILLTLGGTEQIIITKNTGFVK
jgi:prepilin-type N-terminal cleavage/methylation domain-containing protein